MKRFVLLLVLLLLLCGCAKETSIVGSWEVESAVESDSTTYLHLAEDGTGSWEVKSAALEDGVHLPFLYILKDNQLTICYENNSKLQFKVDFEDGKLLLDGEKYYILSPVH